MPAAAVIPAPIAYIKVVAVKKLVVGFLPRATDPLSKSVSGSTKAFSWDSSWSYLTLSPPCSKTFTLRKLKCFKQANAMNTLAWNNRI